MQILPCMQVFWAESELTHDVLPFRASVRELLPDNTTLPAAAQAGPQNGSCSEDAGHVTMTEEARACMHACTHRLGKSHR